jgi:hypothetical protein
MPIENEPSGDGREVGAGLFDAVGIDPGHQHLAKRIGGSVLGVRMIAQPSLDMLQQPTVMIAEKVAQLAGRRRLHRWIFQMLV